VKISKVMVGEGLDISRKTCFGHSEELVLRCLCAGEQSPAGFDVKELMASSPKLILKGQIGIF
jgi:hypothetical protein